MNDRQEDLVTQKFRIKKKKILDIVCFILSPVIILGLMILILNYNTDIWYYLKPKAIIFSLFLLELVHIFLTVITRK